MTNLFAELPAHLPDEVAVVLAQGSNVRIERILSMGHASPEDFWYDQPDHEWVVLLRGEALLQFEDADESIRLKPGDYVTIKAHRRHRVQWTTPDVPTVWLAVFYAGAASQP